MKLPIEEVEEMFKKLFENEHVAPEMYRIYVRPTELPARYRVVLVWDGFEPMSLTARSQWLGERLRKIAPVEIRRYASQVVPRSAKEFVKADEIALHSGVDSSS